jgi:hypothetical protein
MSAWVLGLLFALISVGPSVAVIVWLTFWHPDRKPAENG